jgi:hypothetical protein
MEEIKFELVIKNIYEARKFQKHFNSVLENYKKICLHYKSLTNIKNKMKIDSYIEKNEIKFYQNLHKKKFKDVLEVIKDGNVLKHLKTTFWIDNEGLVPSIEILKKDKFVNTPKNCTCMSCSP